jgi:glycosyltransferase involved in cell wall biosynthesis
MNLKPNKEPLSSAYIVIPAYNEEDVIKGVVENLLISFRNVVVVDDGSKDRTSKVLANTPVMVLRHLDNLGQGAALQTGIDYALSEGAEYIITFDADGQHKAEDAVEMVKLLHNGSYDAVLGSRFLGETTNIPFMRWIILKMALLFGNVGRKTKLTDAHNGLRAMNRKAADVLEIQQNGMAHASEIIQKLMSNDLVIREYPVTIQYTEHSLSKGQSSSNAINIILDLIVVRLFR